MTPAILLKKLNRLRRWECFLRLVWGSARWLALVLGLLALACLIDFVIDRYYETPLPLRLFLFGLQVIVAVVGAAFLVVKPLTGGLSDSHMALLVEEKFPALQHRLISVIQFHRPGARTAGMSPDLIVRVTEETRQLTGSMRFASVADSRRLGWGVGLALPTLVLAGLALAAWPATVQALLARQALLDAEIPRSVHIAGLTPEVLPRGEKFALRFRIDAKNPLPEGSVGEVRVDPDRQVSRSYALIRDPGAPAGDNVYLAAYRKRASGDGDEWVTELDEAMTNFTYHAWLGDGRTREPRTLRFEPRPVVERVDGWAVLPTYCGVRPESQQPYEIEQPRGDIVTIADASGKVRIKVQKPVKTAKLQLLGAVPLSARPTVITALLGMAGTTGADAILPVAGAALAQAGAADAAEKAGTALPEERVLDEVTMTLGADGSEAEVTFPLPPTGTGYRVLVHDEYGFANIPAPRRTIRIVPEDAPQVALLPEEFSPGGEFALLASDEPVRFDGMPVPPGGRVRVAYTCTGPYGLGAARLWFRVFKHREDDSASAADNPEPAWIFLPLREEAAKPGAGPFKPRLGAFQNSPDDEQVPFHAVPSPAPEVMPGRTSGGGRFDFNTTQLPDNKGGFYALEPGDQLEFFVEVFADRDVHAGRPSGRTEVRQKNVVSVPEFVRWLDETLQEERRIRSLENKQRDVFPLTGSSS